MRIGYDATDYIKNAISEVLGTLIDTLLIVMVVIFLFLGSMRAGVYPDRCHSLVTYRRCFCNAGLRLYH